jgi:unsaturated rhamnogalacturonyl hydrolase
MKFLPLLAVVLTLPLPADALGAPEAHSTANNPWDAVGAILDRIKAPHFPDRDFPITDFGAKADDQSDDSAAISKAIEACHDAGGGRVVVPAGRFLTGAVHLKSNVNLFLSAGATLQFLTDPGAYLPVVHTRWEGTECLNYSAFIYAFEQENIAITGEGTLDGAASDENWWAWARRGESGASKAGPDAKKLVEMGQTNVPVPQRVFGEGHFLRPNFIQPYRCKNVLIEGVTLHRSPMWELNPVLCTNVIVRKVTIESDGPNNDGCDPDSCKDVLIEECSFTTGDDCIAIKSGRNNDGRRVGVATENVVVRNCAMNNGHAGVAIGSEVAGDVRNVFIEKCRMDGPQFDRALRLKSNAVRGGTIENIHMREVEIGRVNEAILTIDMMYEEGANGPFQPIMRNVSIDRCTSRSSPRALWILGIPNGIVDDIRLSNSTFSAVETAEVISNAGRVVLDHVNIVPAKKVEGLHSRPPGSL